jgi:hypothetical protein
MAIQVPLIIDNDGNVRRMSASDTLDSPETTNFTYTTGKLTQVSTVTGTVNLTYNGNALATVVNSKTGKTATLTYAAGKLSYITISDT